MATTAGSRNRRTTWIAVQTGVAAVLIGGAILLAFHPFGNSDDHYTPPTTDGDRAPVKASETAPDFTLPNAKGEPVSLHDFRGTPLIFVFFRTFG